jgi:hypothetical protein
MSNLRSELSTLASNFADAVLAAIRGASLEDLLAETGGAPGRANTTKRTSAAARASGSPHKARIVGGRLARRAPGDIENTLGMVVAMLKATPVEGARSEEIRSFLKLDKRELPRVLKMGLEKKVLKSKGQKRATRYFAK